MDTDAARGPNARASRRTSAASALLALYAIVIGTIAFWPVPVERGFGRFLMLLSNAVPWLTHARIEFGANVLMFVPFGILVALILRERWMLAVPLALAVSGLIEVGQAIFLFERTSSLLDIVANVSGAAVGAIVARGLSRRVTTPSVR